MIGDLPVTGAIRRRIIGSVLPLLLVLPRRASFKQLATWGDHNEGTHHNWFGKGLCLDGFNRSLIDQYYFVTFDHSFLPKSGKKSSSLGLFRGITEELLLQSRTGRTIFASLGH